MPVAWMIAPYRAGELNQVRALADAAQRRLGLRVREISLRYRPLVAWPHVFGAASLTGIERASRAVLAAPWPDLVLTAGVRNEPVARWLVRASKGKTRYVHVGKPWGALAHFDLLVTTPQYRVPDRANVLNNDLTLHAIGSEHLEGARSQWQPTFTHLPQPRLGVLVGGHSGPFTLGPGAARRLASRAASWAARHGGALLVSTSARTPAASAALLRRTLEADPALSGRLYFYDYGRADGQNPYPGLLALADEFLVTADSVGMLSELCATGKPIALFDLGGMRGRDGPRRDRRLGASLYRLLMAALPQRLSRDITRVHDAVVGRRLAFWEDGPRPEMPAAHGPAPSPDLERALARIAALLPRTG